MKKSIFKDLIKIKKKNIKSLMIGVIFAFLTSASLALLPFLLIVVQDKILPEDGNFIENEKIIQGVYFIILMIAIGFVGFGFSFISKWQLSYFATQQISDIRIRLFKKILYISPQSTANYSSISLNSRLSTDLTNFFNFFCFLCTDFIPALSRIIVFGIASIAINPLLSLIYFILVPVVLFPTLFLTKFANKFYLKNTVNNDNLNKILEENINGIKVVKALNLANREKKRFAYLNKKLFINGFKADSYTILCFPFILAFIFASFGFLLLISGAIVGLNLNVGKYGEISSAEIISFSTYLFLALFAIFEIALLKSKQERAKPSAARIKEILYINDPIKSKKNLNFENGDIIFKNVSFKFNNESSDNVLTNINLKIRKGSKFAIIGPTGCGKTTLVKMIPRGFDPTSGAIFINNKNIKFYKISELLKNVSIIFQDKMIFSGSIRENIEFGQKNLDYENLEKAVQISQAKEFITNKENTFDFVLEKKGSNLSGGQQQRINIARGVSKKTPILILDDSTSALDNITEKKINDELDKIENITLIVVTQRIKSIKNIENIVVLDKGFIKGIGNHDSLMKNCDFYKKICESQGIKR